MSWNNAAHTSSPPAALPRATDEQHDDRGDGRKNATVMVTIAIEPRIVAMICVAENASSERQDSVDQDRKWGENVQSVQV